MPLSILCNLKLVNHRGGENLPKTVCIIGAGIGGLTAAAYLAKAGYQVTVIESPQL